MRRSEFVVFSKPSTSSSSAMGANHIEHRVSKMDTLAGVAIMYGVEVSDIKRMNGLVTDLQMFAHKTLQIPLPGRHPPSPNLANGSANNGFREQTPPCVHPGNFLDSFQSLKLKPQPQRKVSTAMSVLQGYYGLTPPRKGPPAEGTERVFCRTGRVLFLEDGIIYKNSPVSDPHQHRHRKARSLVNDFFPEVDKLMEDVAVIEVGEGSEAELANSEKPVRRRQKADVSPFPQLLQDSSAGFTGKTGKGVALRPKACSRTDNEINFPNSSTTGDFSMSNGFQAFRKSSSTSNLQESVNGPPVWPPWNLKPDLIARPIFDGLPKPMSRRNKAALD